MRACAAFTAIIISLSAACVYFSVAAPQITSPFDIRKFICESVLRFHWGKNWDDQLLERTINKIPGCRFMETLCGTVASQMISPATAAFKTEVEI